MKKRTQSQNLSGSTSSSTSSSLSNDGLSSADRSPSENSVSDFSTSSRSSDSSNTSDASDDDSECSLVNVNFEFFDVESTDGPYLGNMITNLLAPLSISKEEIFSLVNGLISKEAKFIGSTIKLITNSDTEDSGADAPQSNSEASSNAPIAFIGMSQDPPGILKEHSDSVPFLLKCHSIMNFPSTLTISLFEIFSKENVCFNGG